MKISAALVLAAAGGASAYSVNRSTLRSLGQKSVGNTARAHVRSNDIKMEGELQKFMFESASIPPALQLYFN